MSLFRTHPRVCIFAPSQSCKGELLKLAGSLLLVYGKDVPELAEGVKTMLGWCDQALADNEKNKKARRTLIGLHLQSLPDWSTPPVLTLTAN